MMEAEKSVRRLFARGGRPAPVKDPATLTVIDALAMRTHPDLCVECGWTVEEVEDFLDQIRRPDDAA
jgi:hypothetical protein